MTTLLEMASEQARRMGRRIAERRKELGWTQRELAENIPAPKVTADYVSKWERGEHAPSDEHMPLLCTALGVDEFDLRAGPISERKPKGETPDPFATVSGGNGDMPELHAELATLHGKVDELLSKVELLASAIDALSETGEEPAQEPTSKTAGSSRRTPRRATG